MDTIVVLGATGQQGNSVVNSLLQNGNWKVRGVTRNLESEPAKKLAAKGVEVVAADANDESSLVKAFAVSVPPDRDRPIPWLPTKYLQQGASAVFSLTNYWESLFQLGRDGAGLQEQKQQTNIANAAAKTPTLKHYVFSTLPPAGKVSGGQLKVPHFDYKAAVEDYIRETLPELASKTTYLWVGWYASNLTGLKPLFDPVSGKSIWLQPSIGSAKLPIAGQTSVNVGIAVEAIVSNPELTKGKYVPLVTDYLSFEEVIKEWSAVTGKNGVYSEVSDVVAESIWGIYGSELASQFRWSESYPNWSACKPENEVVSLEKLGIREKVVGLKAALEALKSDL
ncbi:hypothetical protein V501_02430 [Pseudogymnoascus sp. VKM F-4519 (FW-2642)]|nr:hypothetical protein V501_02430 [Pseudogymnoascus sp. VKM F-4519 (FW-2642)]